MAFRCLHRDSQRVAEFDGWKFVLRYKSWGVGGRLEKTTWEGCKIRGSFSCSTFTAPEMNFNPNTAQFTHQFTSN
jgi:hypothetical protein